MGLLDRVRGLIGGDAGVRYECRDCGRTFEEERQVCTGCGGTDVVELEPA